MPRMSPADKFAQLLKVTAAWERLQPLKTYFGMTVEQFKAATRPCYDTRASIADLQKRLRVDIALRNRADKKATYLLNGVAQGVRGDAAEGRKGLLYSAMGYRPGRKRRLKRP